MKNKILPDILPPHTHKCLTFNMYVLYVKSKKKYTKIVISKGFQ